MTYKKFSFQVIYYVTTIHEYHRQTTVRLDELGTQTTNLHVHVAPSMSAKQTSPHGMNYQIQRVVTLILSLWALFCFTLTIPH